MIKQIKHSRTETILKRNIIALDEIVYGSIYRYYINNYNVATYTKINSILVFQYDMFLEHCSVSHNEEIKTLLTNLLYDYFIIKDMDVLIRLV